MRSFLLALCIVCLGSVRAQTAFEAIVQMDYPMVNANFQKPYLDNVLRASEYLNLGFGMQFWLNYNNAMGLEGHMYGILRDSDNLNFKGQSAEIRLTYDFYPYDTFKRRHYGFNVGALTTIDQYIDEQKKDFEPVYIVGFGPHFGYSYQYDKNRYRTDIVISPRYNTQVSDFANGYVSLSAIFKFGYVKNAI